jgi:CubicO group peptidase (beta-lactamase class C family)
MDPLGDAVAQIGAPHSAAAIVDDGGVLESTGDQARVFPLASVTKILTAYAVLIAVEEKTVDLDQPAGPPGSTVRHLLAHASGLGTERNDRIASRPGLRRVYSNGGIETLADLVASESSIPFGAYLAESVFGPLGMDDSVLEGSAARDGGSTCADLSRFVSELLAPTLIDRTTLALATSVAFPGLDGVLPGYGMMRPCDWGLGFELRDHKHPHWTGALNAPETFGHFGQSGTCVSVDPVERLGVVVLTDLPFGEPARTWWPQIADAAITRHRRAR